MLLQTLRFRLIAPFLAVLILINPPFIFAQMSFNNALQMGKDLGGTNVNQYRPDKLDQTLQNKGLGSAREITPRGQEAQGQQGSYTQYYTNPGGMGGFTGNQSGQFMEDTQNRPRYDLTQDPIFSSQCLQRGEDGKCLRWSSSQDIITQSYPDCEKVVIPLYNEDQTYHTCTGTSSQSERTCITRAIVSIVTEEVQGPCNQITIDEKPGQIYAVCRDRIRIYRVPIGNTGWCPIEHYARARLLCTGCGGNLPPGNYCSYCWQGSCPDEYYTVTDVSELPGTYQYLGTGIRDVEIRGKSGDRIARGVAHHYYHVTLPSIIERVIVTHDSTCGDKLNEYIRDCTVTSYKKCDNFGMNCVHLIENGELTGETAPELCQDFPATVGGYQTQVCDFVCQDDHYEGCINDCYTGVCTGCGNAQSCTEAREICRGECDGPFGPCNNTCNTNYDSCLSQCGQNQQCQNDCTTQFNLCKEGCSSERDQCYGSCEEKTTECSNCTVGCQEEFCGFENCQIISVNKYEICALSDSSQGIKINNALATKVPYRNFFTTQHQGNTITWQTLLGGAGVMEALNDWHSEVKFSCHEEEDGCKSLKDQGCYEYERRCLDQTCQTVEYTYVCGKGGIQGYQVAYVCSGQIRCMGTECVDASYDANEDFPAVLSAMEVLNNIKFDTMNRNSIFPGVKRECQSSPEDCCKEATGSGMSIGDYVSAAKSVQTLYNYAFGGLYGTTWANYANAFTYVLTWGEAGSLSGLLGTTISEALGTTTATLWTSSGTIVGEHAVQLLGAEVITEGAVTAVTIDTALISTLSTLATVITIIYTVYSILKFIYDWIYECKKEDLITSQKIGLRLCVRVGSYCSSKFGICWKKKETYCCFNSILARIIHVQGRPQLGIGWGRPENPNCRGFTPSELAALDFSKIDLREYIKHIKQKTDISPEKQQEIIDRIKQRYLQQ